MSLSLATSLACDAHKVRRDGVKPYITHPAAVAARLVNESEDVQMTAWLHDVLEDSCATVESLRRVCVPERVIAAVVAITKQPGEPYLDYLARVKADDIA